MMTPTEVVNVVNNIEQDIFDQTGCEYFNLVYNSNGFVDTIEFLGIRIWNSDDDMRLEVEKDVYEPLETYLRREIGEEILKLSKIKL